MGRIQHAPRARFGVGTTILNREAPAPRPLEPGLTATSGIGGLAAFALFMLGVSEVILRADPIMLLEEGGPIETMQLALLAASMAIFASAARLEGSGSVLVLASLALGIALVRELDGPLDRLWHGSWKVPALGLAVVGAYYAWVHRRTLPSSFRSFAESPAAGMGWGAAAVILIQSRFLGRQRNWHRVLGEDYQREIPRLVEETTELAGYGLIVLSALEARRWLQALAAQEAQRRLAARGPGIPRRSCAG